MAADQQSHHRSGEERRPHDHYISAPCDRIHLPELESDYGHPQACTVEASRRPSFARILVMTLEEGFP